MAQVKEICRIDSSGLQRTLTDLERNQLPFAIAKSLTGIAKASLTGIQQSMETKFDDPTSYTLNSMYVTPATKRKLQSSLQFKDQATRGTPASRYLLPEVTGGERQKKPFETIEQRAGLLPRNMVMVPASGMDKKLNSYGNVPLPTLEKILSTVNGVTFTRNDAKRSKRQSKKPLDLFVGSPGGGRFPMGIYQRTKSGGVTPLFVFASKARYKTRLPIGEIAGGIYEADFPAMFEKAFAEALKNAK